MELQQLVQLIETIAAYQGINDEFVDEMLRLQLMETQTTNVLQQHRNVVAMFQWL
jgi:hypothetical protein